MELLCPSPRDPFATLRMAVSRVGKMHGQGRLCHQLETGG
jgi:hypothetical protein